MHLLQAPPKQTFAEPARRFASLLGTSLGATVGNSLPRPDADKIDQSEDAYQSAQAMLLCHSRTFQIEAPALESLKQALNFPSTTVIREQISPLATGNNQPFSLSERLSSEVYRNPKEKKSACFAAIGLTKEGCDFPILFLGREDAIVLFDSESKRNFIFCQPF